MNREFPLGKEAYCPACYFEHSLVILRVDCKHNRKKVGIMGYGEVGKAIASFYTEPFIHDPEGPGKYQFPTGIELDILHVCIPYKSSVQFTVSVKLAISQYAKSALVFIHSTVPVGTTEELGKDYKFIVHSPVRGVHPNLADGLKTFPKYIGADFAGAGRLATEHLDSIGIKGIVLYKSAATELLKLLDTTYYGLAIAYHAYAAGICERVGVNFDTVMTEANTTYNAGYTELGKSNVVRPVLTPPEGGKIGGHCIIPNAELLKEQFGDDAILESILRHK